MENFTVTLHCPISTLADIKAVLQYYADRESNADRKALATAVLEDTIRLMVDAVCE